MGTAGYFARNSVIRITSFAVGVGFALFVTPVVVGTLGKAGYGVWVLVSSVACYFLLLEGGVMQAVSRHAAAALARDDLHEVDRICTAGVALHALSCGLALCVTGVLALCADVFASDQLPTERLRQCLVIYSICLSLFFLFRSYTGLLMAEMRWTLIAVLGMLRSAFTSLAVLFMITPENGLWLLAAVNGGGFLLEGVTCFYFARGRGLGRVRVALFDAALARELLGYGWAFTVTQFGESMRYRSQNYIIALFAGVREVAVFSIAMQFIGYFLSLMQSAFGIMVPYFSRMQAHGDGENAATSLLFALRLSYVTASFIGLCLVFYGQEFIVLWLGSGFAEAHDVLVPLTVGAVCSLGMLPADGYLLGTARHRMLARCAMAEGLCIVLLSLALAGPFGMVGVAWAYCVVALVVRGGVVPWFVFTQAGLPISAYARLLAEVAGTHVAPQVLLYLFMRDMLGTGYLQLVFLAGMQGVLAVTIQSLFLRLARGAAEAAKEA